MPNAVAIRQRGGLSRADKGRLSLFQKTVGKDLTPTEINEAVDWCEVYNANPFTRDIYFFVFDAKDHEKRRLAPVLSIGMYRKIASRAGDYRPDENPPVFTYDESLQGPANPRGIVDCTVTAYKYSHGGWHPIRERVRWDERAPLVTETWEGPRGQRRKVTLVAPILDPAKKNWHTMPETMLAKCAEAAAIRKGWPEETSGSYADGELDGATIELSASEIVEQADHDERQARIGGPSILIDWLSGPLVSVPVAELHGKVRDFIKSNAEEPMTILSFADRNRDGMRQFWAHKPDEALDLKRAFETYANTAKVQGAA